MSSPFCIFLSEKNIKADLFYNRKTIKQHMLFHWKNLGPLFYEEY